MKSKDLIKELVENYGTRDNKNALEAGLKLLSSVSNREGFKEASDIVWKGKNDR